METVVLPPQDQFRLQYENQNRRMSAVQHDAKNPDPQTRHGEASFKGQVFNDKPPQNQFDPISYGILPHPRPLQFPPPVNNMQFVLPFPCVNISQGCSSGVQASPVSGFHNRPAWSFSSPPECEVPNNNGVFGLPHPCLIPYHHSPFPSTATSPSPHPPQSISSFLADTQPIMSMGRKWHSMPEGFLYASPSANEIPKGGTGAPLFRSRSANIPSCGSPEHGIFPDWHRQSCPSKHVSLVNIRIPKVAENGMEDYKKARPWQPVQKPGKEVDRRSPKPVFEWKLVDSGSHKPQNEGRFGPEKQVFTASQSHKPTNEKKSIAKKVMNSVKNGGVKNKNARDTSSPQGKFITLLKRPPKSETAVKYLTQALGDSTITNTIEVSGSQKGVGKADSDGSSTHHQSFKEKAILSHHDDISDLSQNKSNNYEAGIDYNGCNKLWDHKYEIHSDCDSEERIVFQADSQGYRKNESGQNLTSIASLFNAGDFHSKESSQTSQVELKVSTEAQAIENSLDPEGGLFYGGTGSRSIDDIGKEVCEVSPCLYIPENWAGPAYTNSPPPSSLPFPRFSMREMRSASLDLPPTDNELSEAAISAAMPGSLSAPPSPTRDAPECSPLQGKLQDLSLDAVSATRDLRRMLNLDFHALTN